MAWKILLIQKNNAADQPIADFLRECGFEVVEVISGLEGAFTLYRGSRFDLTIYDERLTESDLITFAAALSSTHRAIPVIGMISSPSHAHRVLFRGRTEWIQKPISLQRLLLVAFCLLSRQCRRRIGAQTWHACTNCKDWPDSHYEDMTITPAGQLELCNECRLNLSQGKCL